ncbi:MAG: tRNA (N(6)-L-threonylcarbamoyladenosine(37)-C(2))-methylthiotransferase MtaB [Bacillota bacterium]|jgi:threonylcarbamoyladenosine tRNA methylthiotransferase MtaB
MYNKTRKKGKNMKREMPTFSIYTLGCKVNQEEGAALAALFTAAGYRQVSFSDAADIYIINTCTVTHVADKKCRSMIRRAVKANAQALIIVTGCYAQVATEKVAAIDGVDLIVGVNERADLLSLVEKYWQDKQPIRAVGDISRAKKYLSIGNGLSQQERARAYLKVEDGCDQFCNYCLVPYARGPVRSLPIDEAVQQASLLLAQGHREIVLSGIHIGAYGQDLPGANLFLLIDNLLQLPGDWRLRLSSIEPQQLDDKLLDLLAKNKKICPHLHIPLQSGSDKILLAMGRKYDTRKYAALLHKLRAINPFIAITSDIMVGYPVETEQDFAESYDFCRAMKFAGLHIFPYSRRQGTPAAQLCNQVQPNIKERRVASLSALAQEMATLYGQSFIGKELFLLLEQKAAINGRDYWYGHSENYLPLYLPYKNGQRGEIVKVVVEKPLGYEKNRKNKKEGFFSRLAGNANLEDEY